MDTYQTLAYQIFTFLLSVLILAIVFSFFFKPHLTITRSLPRFATVGVEVQYQISIYNASSKPEIGLRLLEDFADPRPTAGEFLAASEPREQKRNSFDRALGYYRWLWLIRKQERLRMRAIALPPLPPRSTTEVTVEVSPLQRGIARLTAVTIARPDPFGLFQACRFYPLPQTLSILPKRYRLPPFSLPGSRRYQSGGVALASSVGDAEEFMSLRDYQPGDPLRKIHWKSWAKVGKPIVREEQDEFFVRHALILDTFQTQKESDRLEAAISIAASFACNLQTQDTLLDLMFVGLEAYCFTVGRGVGHQEQMLEILAAVEACQDKAFEYLTPTVVSRASLLSGCICIFLDWDLPRQALIAALRGLQIPALGLVLTDTETTPPEDLPAFVHFLPVKTLQESLNGALGQSETSG